MKPDDAAFVPDALVMSERAVHLLRQESGALADYYIGTLPFLLALLFFWSDMSRNPYAEFYCAPAAGGLALLFVWMKLWHARFCRRLWTALNHAAPEVWPLRRCWHTALRQAALQATGLVLLPIAGVIMLPLAWCYAFYQNASVLEAPDTERLPQLAGQAWQQAKPWPGQNHLLLTILSVFGLLVLFNVAIGLMLLPYLFKWLLGLESAFTFSGLRAMTNTTFLAITAALTYACLDPVIKAAYTLRCFYGQSRHTGADLLAALKPFLKGLPLVVLWTGAALVTPPAACAAEPPATYEFVAPLDGAIEHVLQQRRFAWRLPREKEAAETPRNWLTRGVAWLVDKIGAGIEALDEWIDSLAEWLRGHFPEPEGDATAGRDWRGVIRILFYAIGVLLLVLLMVLLRRWLQGRRKPVAAAAGPAPSVDIRDETLTAADLPSDRWLTLARELIERRDFRHALRALYLSVLAQLGDHGRLAIARYKSNREYFQELSRRIHAEPELVDRFGRCMQTFERTWYGLHPVAEGQLTDFIQDQERIALLVQQAV